MEAINDSTKILAKAIAVLLKFSDDNDIDNLDRVDEVIVQLQIALDKLVDMM